jgi:hypothetical protein
MNDEKNNVIQFPGLKPPEEAANDNIPSASDIDELYGLGKALSTIAMVRVSDEFEKAGLKIGPGDPCWKDLGVIQNLIFALIVRYYGQEHVFHEYLDQISNDVEALLQFVEEYDGDYE